MSRIKKHNTTKLLSLNPETLIILGILGFYSLVGYVEWLLPSEGPGGLLVKAGIYIYILLTTLKFFNTDIPNAGLAYLPGVIFLFIYGIRLFWNFEVDGVGADLGKSYILLHFLVGLSFSVFAAVKVGHLIDDDMFFRVITILCVLFIGSLLLNIQQVMDSWSTRLSLEKINPISMSLIAGAFILYYIVAVSKDYKYLKVALFLLPILFLVFVQAKSRGSIVAGAASLLAYAIFAPGKERIKFLFGAGLFFIIFLIFFGEEIYETIFLRMETINVSDASTMERLISWRGAWDQFLENPTFGKYFFELTYRTYPHNIYLESLMSVGIGGSVFLFSHVLVAYIAAISIIRKNRFSVWAVFMSVLFIRESIAAASAGSLWGSSGFWISSFLVISLWFSGYKENIKLSRKA
ncbi:MAG: O-antigen ligase family protein [Thiotrichales bacterium]